MRKRPLDAGLGRQGAVRKRKDEVHEMNGHKFVRRQFYQIIMCAFCGEFLLDGVGYQCEDCRYTCHKKCYEKVVTKCISKSNTGVSGLRIPGTCALFRAHSSYRTTTGRRSTIAYPTVSNQSPISVQTGVVIADICFRWAERTPGDVQNAILPATPTVLIWFLTFVACLWKRPTHYCVTGRISTRLVVDAPPSKSRRRQGTVLKRNSRTLVHPRYQRLPQISARTWVD